MRRYLTFIGTVFFICSPLFARWSAIENIDKQDILNVYGALCKGRSIGVDVFDNKHVGYVTQDTLKGTPYAWHYGHKSEEYIYDQWVDTIIYKHTNQMPFPPHVKPIVATDNQGRCHYAWSYIDDATTMGWIYCKVRDAIGNWGPLIQISPAEVERGGDIAIGIKSDGIRRVVLYTCFEAGQRHLKMSITTDNGNNWTKGIDISYPVDEATPSAAIDEAGYIYILYQKAGLKCQLRDPTGISTVWTRDLGGVFGQCCVDPVNGNVHFVNIQSENVIYQYRLNGDTDSSASHWYGLTTLLTGSLSELAAIGCYNSTVGIISGFDLDQDTLYFKRESGVWDTTKLPRMGASVYVGKSVAIDTGGYAHIVGNSIVSGVTPLPTDSVFYFTDRVRPGIIIIPDTLVIPDTGGQTNPGVPISYMHRVINQGNLIDTFGLYIASTKIDSIAALYRGADTAYYPNDTLWIFNTWPEDTDTVYLLIVPSDTCWACFMDTTKFIGYSVYNSAVRDSAIDTTHVIIDVILSKEAVSPPPGPVNPLDTITYRIIIEDTWKVHIDSITIYDLIDPEFTNVWVESTTAINDTYYFSLDTLVWTIWDQHPPDYRDTLILKGIVKTFDCNDTFPQEVQNFVYTEGTPCIIGDTTAPITHTIDRVDIDLWLSKTADHPDSDTVYPGDLVTYYIECRNDSVFPARDVIIKDTLDDDVDEIVYCSGDTIPSPGAVTWDVGCLLANSAYYCTLQIRVGYEYKAVYERLDTLYNVAFAWGNSQDVPDTSFSDSTIHFILRRLDIYFDKSADPPSGSVVEPGDSIHYRLWFYNDTTANSIIIDTLIIVDILDPLVYKADHITTNTGGFLYFHPDSIRWFIYSLAPGDSFVGTFYGFVDTFALPGDSVLDYFRAFYCDSIDAISNTTVHYIGKERIIKEAIPPSGSWVKPNDIIHYMLTYYNPRPDTVFGVTIVDTVDTLHLDTVAISGPTPSYNPPIITWNIGDIPPNDSFKVWYNAQVKPDTQFLGDTIINWGVFISPSPDTGSDSTSHYIGMPIPNLMGMKSSTPDSGAIVNPGQVIDYQLNCKNVGNLDGIPIVIIDTVTNVTNAGIISISRGTATTNIVDSTLELIWTIDTLFAGANESIQYNANVANAVGDSVVNFAISDTFFSNKTIHYIEIPLLWVNKDGYPPYPDSSVVYPGETICYYIAFQNQGGDTAHQVIVWDIIDTNLIIATNISPPGYLSGDTIIWELGNLNPGYSDTHTYDGYVKLTAPEDTIVNACWSYGVDTDTIGDTTYHFIRKRRAMKWAQPLSGTIVRPRDTLKFWLRYSSGITDTLVVIRDTLSVLLDTPPVAPGGTWAPGPRTITWIDTIPPLSSDTVWFKAAVCSTAACGDTVRNYGILYSAAGTFWSDTTWHPVGLPNVKLQKTAIPPSGSYVTCGDIIEYTLHFDNIDGCDTARNIIVYDTLSNYFVSPDTMIWNVGKLPPGAAKDTTFERAIKPVLDDTAWGDTVFNIPVLLSPTDPDVDTLMDTTYHILTRASYDNIIKRSFKLTVFPLPESSCVAPKDSFYYDITISNIQDVPVKQLTMIDTIRNHYDCVIIDTVIAGPDSVRWHGNDISVPPNVIIWWVPEVPVGGNVRCRFRVHVKDTIEFKNEITDTLDILRNTCWIYGKNVALDSSNTHILFVCFKAGVEIQPDTSVSIFTGESKVCTLRVKNTGTFPDSISVIGKNSTPGWQIFLGGTTDSSYLFPQVPRDTVRLLPVKLVAPLNVSTNMAYVIAKSMISERINKVVKDTAIITCTSSQRIVWIIVEPDTGGKIPAGQTKEYKYMRVINLGNDADVVDIDVVKPDDGWRYELTHPDGSDLVDTDGDTKPDVGAISPNDTTKLWLKLTPPPDITFGIGVSHIDTLVIWGTSSHGTPYDSIICKKDSASVITEVIIPEPAAHNYPNPFPKDEGTTFVFGLPKRSKCTLIIYKRKGEVIRVLFENKNFDAGRHQWPWDATNWAGNKVAAETYIYTFKADGKLIIKKLVVLPPRR